ncbi:hypothetical protein B9G69_001825 [Bdellovibrio sp. SKB1291214]|uniref:hypothetical protein n=1 Tax=Bdellovibrio sp. SKB1291214 TaxID=1732569 RepID=UPI0011321082|nr:hypothetical protein [Bdellovibrio sp. SKB1291214]UYL09309.1 hypothetical protein B9G69_001825 [Bdellovibrio sp. SKB1291214]
MKLIGQFLVVAVLAYSGMAQAQLDGVIEVPVSPGKAELKESSRISGGRFLTLGTAPQQSLNIKCHKGIGRISLMVFLRGNILAQQLSGPVDSMESCEHQLSKIAAEVQAGAEVLRIEVRSDHTLGFSTH